MTFWDYLNAFLRFALTLFTVYKMTQFRDAANLVERLGLGLMGGGSFMTIGVILEGPLSPFDGWAVSVLTIGALMLIGGRTWRDMRHKWANDQQVKISEAWMGRRK